MKSFSLGLSLMLGLAVSCAFFGPALAVAPTKTVDTPSAGELHIYNWNDYIGPNTLADFTKATGIKVIYDQYNSNEELEAKINSGAGGYDIVVPTATPFFARFAQSNVFRPLDKSKIPNLANLDPKLMHSVQEADPGNKFGIIYAWGTNGIGYNVDAIKKRMPNAPVNSWDMVFKPEVARKFYDCGISVLNSGYEVIPLALSYLGLDPQSQSADDLRAAENLLMSVRPFIRKFDSGTYIDALANGEVCLVLGWSGDIMQAKAKAEAAKKGIEIDYNLPKEGTLMWFDMMGVPRNAPNPDAAFKFINFILDPAHMADITNTVAYANAVPSSLATIKPDIKSDADIFPTEEMRKHLFVIHQPSPTYEKLRDRTWQHIVEGR